MKVRLLAMGLFEEYDPTNYTRHLSNLRLEKFYQKKAYHFNFETKIDTKYKISPKGGYFSPLKAETFFYVDESDRKPVEFSSVISRKPSFFAFILPNPVLHRTDLKTGYTINDISHRGQPFNNERFHNKSYIESFKNFSLDSDLAGKISIIHELHDFSFINNFLENNCYPIFIQDQEELCILINDYKVFLEKIFNLNVDIKSFSKTIIPFFKLEEQEKKQLALP
ncbi:hypothetical protein [Algoriphagus sp. Y33]|uniref:hypothetical protein n=1 Tax=Algoriphagus sp. Y33 TaxID=2772483 RepID=UPI00177ADE2C|nr:hypothetical protein [Algoriphagus sp. Y33]